jgi:sulfide dehydrogenase [flavocytochrome c] flavoprotein subunit
MKRRSFVSAAVAAGALGSFAGCASTGGTPSKARVLVVGGGFGGATAAKYVRILSDQKIDVVLVEPNASFVSCPMSNLVLGGSKTMADITSPYDGLEKRHGVKRVSGMVASIDANAKTATLATGETMAYDKLILSPGIDLMWDQVEGLQKANADGKVLQAWKAGPETLALRKQLEACPTAASMPSPSPRPPTAARLAPTSAPARSPATSKQPSPSPRSSSWTPTRTSPPKARCSRKSGPSSTKASSSTAASTKPLGWTPPLG